MHTDETWQKIGRENPYYGVSSFPQYENGMSEKDIAEFFESGERHVKWVYDTIMESIDRDFAP